MIRRQPLLPLPLLNILARAGIATCLKVNVLARCFSVHRARNGQPVTFNGQSQSEWIPTIGLELHVQLKSPVKLFSRAVTSYDAIPNKHVAAFDAALPGALPVHHIPALFNAIQIGSIPLPCVKVLNVEPVKLALRAAMALNCRIHKISRCVKSPLYIDFVHLGLRFQIRPKALFLS